MRYFFVLQLLLCCSLNVHAAPIVYFDFNGDGLQDSSANITLGSSFTASIMATNIDDPVHGGLIGWGSDIGFDNTQLTATDYTIDTLWPFQGIDNNINNASGHIELTASTILGQSGTVKLADISFDTVTSGTSLLLLSELFAGNPDFTGFAAADGFDYDPDVVFNNASITISSVPIPPAAVLFLSGLIGLISIHKKRA